MKYNNNRHLMLLKFKKNAETRSEINLELLKHEMFLQDHIYWENKKDFIILIGYFIDNFISYKEFEPRFSLVWQKSMENFLKIRYDIAAIKGFYPEPKSSKFCSKMTVIYRHFEQLEEEFCTEKDIEICVKEIYKNL